MADGYRGVKLSNINKITLYILRFKNIRNENKIGYRCNNNKTLYEDMISGIRNESATVTSCVQELYLQENRRTGTFSVVFKQILGQHLPI